MLAADALSRAFPASDRARVDVLMPDARHFAPDQQPPCCLHPSAVYESYRFFSTPLFHDILLPPVSRPRISEPWSKQLHTLKM